MSRIANNPVAIPAGVNVEISGNIVRIKGKKGEMVREIHPDVGIARENDELRISLKHKVRAARAIAGTTRALVQNMVKGVTEGYQRKLEIVGVGYRAQVQGRTLNLTLGFSHPVQLSIPDGITVETPSQTEIIVRGTDKHLVGQLAANIRAYRSPEPYKGKGVRYANEQIVRKEAKKA
ncbi:MAG: 50S ribosomal protein L6 [Gammaproteobacteria bacterium]|nr:50S ribosomal protein L6 [Gammaproteobacteria bacterium]